MRVEDRRRRGEITDNRLENHIVEIWRYQESIVSWSQFCCLYTGHLSSSSLSNVRAGWQLLTFAGRVGGNQDGIGREDTMRRMNFDLPQQKPSPVIMSESKERKKERKKYFCCLLSS